MEKYKFLSHTADIKFQAFGKSLEDCFLSGFEALKETMTKSIQIKERNKKKIKIKGMDLKNLLYNFLEEFLFLLDAKDFITSKVSKIKINQTSDKKFELIAEIYGDKASNYKISNSVKAITYSEMLLNKENNKFVCQVVMDV